MVDDSIGFLIGGFLNSNMQVSISTIEGNPPTYVEVKVGWEEDGINLAVRSGSHVNPIEHGYSYAIQRGLQVCLVQLLNLSKKAKT